MNEHELKADQQNMNVLDYLLEYSKELDKNFVIGRSEQVSYRDIYEKALKLAYFLKENYGEGNNIVLISPNNVFFIIVYLGIMKSGNICVPLNPLIEQENLDFILDTCQCKSAFVVGNIALKLDFETVKIFSKIDCDEMINSVSGDYPESAEFDENRLAQVLFTSGSTGFPKGVMLTHKNIIANTDSILRYLQLKQEDIMEVVLPFFYCYGLSLLHTHLRVGGSIVLNNNFVFLGTVIDDLEKYHCTGFAGVPTHFQILLRKSKSFIKKEFPHLRYVTQAGGKLHDVFIKEFAEAFPDKKFFVMYGQTEATARLSFLAPELVIKKLGSIGKSIPGVRLEIFNEKGNIVKPGEVGEIVAKGENIMVGYLNDPESTEQTLRDGWLFTGDMAKKDEAGFIYLVTRKKEIIKVGGKRVSPKEIEGTIVNIPDVIDCTVEGVDDELLGEAIKATVVLTDKITKEEAKEIILKTCGQKLAVYKIPQIIDFTDNITISQTGKKVKK